jgi:hypothetical protein
MLILPEQPASRLGNPFIELGGMTNREPREKARDIGREGEARLVDHLLAELSNVALDRPNQLDDSSIASNNRAQLGTEVLEGLAERGPCFWLG